MSDAPILIIDMEPDPEADIAPVRPGVSFERQGVAALGRTRAMSL